MAARTGGGDPAGNPTLADAIAKAKSQSVPNDNIDRAVKRGSGELGDAADYEAIMYEAYGPSGVAMLIECLTDNRNRAASDVRVAITRNGGTIADPGLGGLPVPPQGRRAGHQDAASMGEDDVLLAVLDAGAEEVNDLGESFEVIAEATDLHAGARRGERRRHDDRVGRHQRGCPRCQVPLDEEGARKVLRLVDALEDLDDVQNVWFNADICDEVMELVEA